MPPKSNSRQCERDILSSSVANAGMVRQIDADVDITSSFSSKENSATPIQTNCSSSIAGQSSSACLSNIRDHFRNKGVSEEYVSLLCSSWRYSTITQCEHYLKSVYISVLRGKLIPCSIMRLQ